MPLMVSAAVRIQGVVMATPASPLTSRILNKDDLTVRPWTNESNPKCRLFCKVDLLTDFAACV
jgi:hypothetical protein